MENVKRTTPLTTVDMDGGKYTKVSERIKFLADNFEYSIDTEVEFIESLLSWKVKATLKIDTEEGFQTYVGHAIERVESNDINKLSALENAETSAVGRACGFAGIGLTDDIASADEMGIVKEEKKRRTTTARQTNVAKTIDSTLEKLKSNAKNEK